MKLKKCDDGWWVTEIPRGIEPIGPYDYKEEAQEAAAGMRLFLEEEIDRPATAKKRQPARVKVSVPAAMVARRRSEKWKAAERRKTLERIPAAAEALGIPYRPIPRRKPANTEEAIKEARLERVQQEAKKAAPQPSRKRIKR